MNLDRGCYILTDNDWPWARETNEIVTADNPDLIKRLWDEDTGEPFYKMGNALRYERVGVAGLILARDRRQDLAERIATIKGIDVFDPDEWASWFCFVRPDMQRRGYGGIMFDNLMRMVDHRVANDETEIKHLVALTNNPLTINMAKEFEVLEGESTFPIHGRTVHNHTGLYKSLS